MRAKLALIVHIVLASLLFEKSHGKNACHFPAIFNFGDSNSDTGFHTSIAGPFGKPYCQTWHGNDTPCNRASDGRLIIDFIAEKLGLPYLPSYGPPERNYSHGISFAYFAMGVDDVSGRQAQLLSEFKEVAIAHKLTVPKPEDFSKSLYTLDIGQNDVYRTLRGKAPDIVAAECSELMNKLSGFIQKIYEVGGRTFWIHNTGPLGCLCVEERLVKDEAGCNKLDNELSQEFNKNLKDMVYKLRKQLKDASIVYVDVYSAKYSLFKDAAKFGFKDPLRSCMEQSPCSNPKEFIKIDGFHYTEAANQIVANRIMDGSLSDPPVPITEACTVSDSSKTEL